MADDPTIHALEQVPMWRWCVRCELIVLPESHTCPSADVRQMVVVPADGVGLAVVGLASTAEDVLAAAAQSMRWTCGQAGHPTQQPHDASCICATWAHHVERGAVVIDCDTEEPDHGDR